MSQTSLAPRSRFDEWITTLCTDLTDFATGAYLAEGDTEYWEEPYPAAVVPLVESVLRGFLDRAYRCATGSSTPASDTVAPSPELAGEQAEDVAPYAAALHREVEQAVAELKRINDSVDDALLDTEESAEFSEFFLAVCAGLLAPLDSGWELGSDAENGR
ncbi:hypothetical protein CCICO_05850 [Corynebacterium ciconiae DSM 44920]|uniref:hypothetical protein n=1 Tax=Corynebacterium ciconiae TaxID=227319 RepID=UPI00037745E7|nr:hypothetical protein [Corynebacterium ciconiae]WKD61198.1 hypothetical protein CCICO_05850 [Corynebacterium ciconiae DSM 44920]